MLTFTMQMENMACFLLNNLAFDLPKTLVLGSIKYHCLGVWHSTNGPLSSHDYFPEHPGGQVEMELLNPPRLYVSPNLLQPHAMSIRSWMNVTPE